MTRLKAIKVLERRRDHLDFLILQHDSGARPNPGAGGISYIRAETEALKWMLAEYARLDEFERTTVAGQPT